MGSIAVPVKFLNMKEENKKKKLFSDFLAGRGIKRTHSKASQCLAVSLCISTLFREAKLNKK